ncbi:hypothetical protein ACLOJK_022610 [Asimina triloba]
MRTAASSSHDPRAAILWPSEKPIMHRPEPSITIHLDGPNLERAEANERVEGCSGGLMVAQLGQVAVDQADSGLQGRRHAAGGEWRMEAVADQQAAGRRRERTSGLDTGRQRADKLAGVDERRRWAVIMEAMMVMAGPITQR